MGTTAYERIEADPRRRKDLRKEELILGVTIAIAQELDRQGLTKKDLAERLGRTKSEVSQILGGGRNLTLATVAEVADVLGCRVSATLEQHGRPAAKIGAGRQRVAMAARHAAAGSQVRAKK